MRTVDTAAFRTGKTIYKMLIGYESSIVYMAIHSELLIQDSELPILPLSAQ